MGYRPDPKKGELLTAREVQVLELVAQGNSNKEIGQALFLTEDTIKTHLRRIFKKLGAKDRANAVTLAFRGQIIG